MQSEKLKALSAKWRKPLELESPNQRTFAKHYEYQRRKCADELDAALASPSPAPSEPLREALIREMFGVQCEWCRLTEPRRVESDGYISNFGPVSVGEFVHDVAKELDYETKWCAAGYLRTWAALDSTKASEPAAPARDAMREAPPDLASAQRGQGLVNELEREIIRLNEELHWVWRDFTMYMNAWCREIGGFIRAKSHQIDGYVLRTRDALAEAKEAGRKEGQADLAPLLERLERYLYNGFEPDNQSHLYHEVKKALAQLKVQR